MEPLPLVLVVADDAAFARSLAILLEEEDGCGVRSVRSADAAIACLDEAPPPSLLIGDLDIGRDETERLVREVRRFHPEIAILVLTAHDPALVAAGPGLVGGCNLLGKPVDPDRLLDLVANLLPGC